MQSEAKVLNVIGDFIDKDICPYCGKELTRKYPTNDFSVECKSCNSFFRWIDSPGPDGYYLPRELETNDYFYTVLRDGHGNMVR